MHPVVLGPHGAHRGQRPGRPQAASRTAPLDRLLGMGPGRVASALRSASDAPIERFADSTSYILRLHRRRQDFFARTDMRSGVLGAVGDGNADAATCD